MIDIESDVFRQVKAMTRNEIPANTLHDQYVRQPSSFPHATLREIDNVPVRSKATSDNTEEVSTLTYELNVFSNSLKGKRQECRKIANALDEALKKLKFKRISLQPIPNMDDATIYRMVGRYEVTVDKHGNLY